MCQPPERDSTPMAQVVKGPAVCACRPGYRAPFPASGSSRPGEPLKPRPVQGLDGSPRAFQSGYGTFDRDILRAVVARLNIDGPEFKGEHSGLTGLDSHGNPVAGADNGGVSAGPPSRLTADL